MPQSPQMRKGKPEKANCCYFEALKECILEPWLKGMWALLRNQSILTALLCHITHRTQSFMSHRESREEKGKGEKQKSSRLIHPPLWATHATVSDLISGGGGGFKRLLILATAKPKLLKHFFKLESWRLEFMEEATILIAWCHVIPPSSLHRFVSRTRALYIRAVF